MKHEKWAPITALSRLGGMHIGWLSFVASKVFQKKVVASPLGAPGGDMCP